MKAVFRILPLFALTLLCACATATIDPITDQERSAYSVNQVSVSFVGSDIDDIEETDAKTTNTANTHNSALPLKDLLSKEIKHALLSKGMRGKSKTANITVDIDLFNVWSSALTIIGSTDVLRGQVTATDSKTHEIIGQFNIFVTNGGGIIGLGNRGSDPRQALVDDFVEQTLDKFGF